jgi:hypothetical protein
MGVSGQHHAPVPIGQEAGWAPEPVWTQARRKILSPMSGIEPRSPGRPARSQTLYCLSYPAHEDLPIARLFYEVRLNNTLLISRNLIFRTDSK